VSVFADRRDAGVRLAVALAEWAATPGGVVLGIPRGGVVVAAEVARALGLPLDIAVAAKVAAPGNPEYAIGAVAPDGDVSVNPGAGYTLEEVREYSGEAFAKVTRYSALLRRGREPLDLGGRTAILVDDGLATGLTAMAAADWARRQHAATVIVAVPVAPPQAVEAMRKHADEVVALETPHWFSAVGNFYHDFTQTSDSEVIALLGA